MKYFYVFNLKMFEKEIKNLISNIEKPKTPMVLDVILEGGAFNGSYELGVCYFLKELERQDYIKVNRVSGTSVGSIVGSLYLLDKLDDYYNAYNKLREHWKRSLNVGLYKEVLNETLTDISNDALDILNDRLFVTYYDITSKQQIVKSSFDNNEDFSYRNFEFKESTDSKKWFDSWKSRLCKEKIDIQNVFKSMKKVNPIYIPRNHILEKVINESVQHESNTMLEKILKLIQIL